MQGEDQFQKLISSSQNQSVQTLQEVPLPAHDLPTKERPFYK